MINTGVDIVQISRIERIIKNKKERFYRRLFTNDEITYLESRNNNSNTVAGLFAAKEAIGKVLGTGIGSISWTDIEIVHNNAGKPMVNLNPKIKEKLHKLDMTEISLSISHEKEYAIAFAIGYYNYKNIK